METQVGSLIKSLGLLKLICDVSPQKIDFSGRGMLTVMRKYLLMQQDLPMKLMLSQFEQLETVATSSGNYDSFHCVLYGLAQKYIYNVLFSDTQDQDEELHAGTISNQQNEGSLLKNYILFSMLYA